LEDVGTGVWEDNIEMDFREISWEGVDWIHLSQDSDQWRAVVKTGDLLTLSFTTRTLLRIITFLMRYSINETEKLNLDTLPYTQRK
jgi:hypothetical protein